MTNTPENIAELSPEKKRELLAQLLQKKVSQPHLFPMSFAQQRLWFVDQLQPGNFANHIRAALRLTGLLNTDALLQTLNEIVRRHEVLRTTFATVEGQLVQLITPTLSLTLPIINLQELPEVELEAEVRKLVTQETQQPFNLNQAPLVRVTLLRLNEIEHNMILTMHHIISDNWSMGVLIQEVAALYEAFSKGQPSPLLELPIQYADFAVWQRQSLQGEVIESQLCYWRRQLDGTPRLLELPTDHPRPTIQSFRGATHSFQLSQQLSVAIKSLSQQQGCTLFMVLLTVFKILLLRYTGNDDIVVGSPIANRNRIEIEQLIGFFVNTLVLRTNLSGNPSFRELLKRVQDCTLGAYAHQDFPFDQLVEKLQPHRDLSYTPLFQVMFVFQNAPMSQLEFPGLTLSPLAINSGTAKFDLTLDMIEIGEELAGTLEYNTDLFESSTISRMANHFQILLESIVANSEQRLWDLPLLSVQESYQLLIEWNDTLVKYQQQQCIHQLFEAQVEQTPDAVAVVFVDERSEASRRVDQQLSYCELNVRANQLAHHLHSLGVKPEVPVGICVERSSFGTAALALHMVIGLLGILKAGGAYVPLDPAYPPERLAFILQDAQVPVLLTQQHLMENLPESQTRIICLDTDWGSIAKESQHNFMSECTTDNLAYIIYTSGSTGQPKGVLVNHANVVRLLAATESWYNFNKQDVFSLFHSIAFDFSVWELWGALLYGGRLIIIPYWLSRSPQEFYKFLSQQQVTVLNQTPSAFRQLIQVEELLGGAQQLNLRLVIFGGEALELQSLKPWFERHGDRYPQLVNMYGITETTVHVTYKPLTVADLNLSLGSVIGRPIPDLQVYVLDQHQQPVPIGVPGEMYIGGAGLARGYLNRPDLTCHSFIPNPFSSEPSARLYRSGDLGRYLPNGDIEYLGRIDYQVKIRGFRIELGEIETVLAQHPAIRETVVLARETQPGDKQLVAYVVKSKERTLTTSTLRKFLKEKLPEYMLPVVFVFLDALPLTPNGKVNRQALPNPDTTRPELDEAFVAPRTSEEKVLAEIWNKVLDLKQVGIYDNFFALGGDSIRSIQVQSQAQERGLCFSLQQLFKHQTIHELVQNLTQSTTITERVQPFNLICEQDRLKLPPHIEDAYPLTKLQMGMVFHSEYSPENAIYHEIFSFHLQAPLDLQLLSAVIKQLVVCHPILRTSFNITSFSEPLQLVHQSVDIPLQVEDLCYLSFDQQQEAVTAWIESEKTHNFDWANAPLLRFQIHYCSEETFQFTVSFHHAILDGWSVASMLTELFMQYFSLLNKEADLLPSSPAVNFKDFVALEQEAITSDTQKYYWTEKLSDSTLTMLPRWPSANHRNSVQQVGLHEVPLSIELSQSLLQRAKSWKVSFKSVLLAAHMRVLSLLSGQSDIVTGLVSHGRPEGTDGERVLGLFLNSLPFRLQFKGGTWIDLVRNTFETEQELLPFRRYPMADLQRVLGKQSLFETAFNFVHFHIYQNALNLKGVQVLNTKTFQKTNFTLTAQFSQDPSSSQVHFSLNFDPIALCEEQVKQIGDYYVRTLTAIAHEPEERYESYCLLSLQEQYQLLIEWNKTKTDYPINQCIHELFEAQVQQNSDAVAVVFESEQLTYSELNRRANQLAHYLQTLGVKPEVLVGICVERSLEMIIGLLGILKAGGAYVPLDPTYPQERLALILEDVQVPVLLTEACLMEVMLQHTTKVICLDTDWHTITQQSQENLLAQVSANNLAYVIYTSGSTGKPKGVQIPHSALSNFLHTMQQTPGLTKQDTLLAVTTYSFDIAALELFLPIIVGACLVFVSRETTLDGAQLLTKLTDSNATVMQATPATWQLLLATGWGGHHQLKILCGGETLPRHLATQLLSRCDSLWNMYGPTETTIWSAACLVETDNTIVPIGHVIANTQFYILDQYGQLVPVGVPGELHIGGDGLARGYLNRPELTAEKFIPNLFSEQSATRLYKTGDLARYLPNGEIEYIGRIDNQIKIRGFRIELGEIEAAISQHPKVRETVVVVRSDSSNSPQIVAYVVFQKEQTLTITQLRDYLESKLPNYMVPAAFVILEALPLTLNGKINRKALPAPDATQLLSESNFTAPSTPIEQMLAGIWAEVLSLEKVGIHNNFFELGGHSLLATRVISQVRQIFQQELPLSCLFEQPTIAGLAREIEKVTNDGLGVETTTIERISRSQELPLSFAQQRLWFLAQLEPNSPFYNIPAAVRLEGQLNLSALQQSFNKILRRHEVLRTNFQILEGQPVAIISSVTSLPFAVIDISELASNQQQASVRKLASQEAQRPFNLNSDLLLRVKLLRLKEQEHIVLLTMHHIASDGWSISVLVRELATLYQAFYKQQPSPLAELPIQYVDFAAWQRQWLQTEILQFQIAYWKKQLEGAPTVLELPTDYPRLAAVQTFRGATHLFELSVELSQAINKLSQQEGCTLFMTLLAAFAILLSCYSGQEDIVVGSPIANRNRVELEGLIGLFLNTLALRTDLSGDPTFLELLTRVRQVTLGAYSHKDLPFEKLVQELAPKRNLRYSPLFQVWFTLQNVPMTKLELPGLTLSLLETDNTTVQFDLELFLSEGVDGLSARFNYNTDLFNATTIAQMANHFEILLLNIVEQPSVRLKALGEKLTEADRQQALLKAKDFKKADLQMLKNIKRNKNSSSKL
ncbi:MAG: amino acid adenylation domain-containing protein [Rhizonema sp. NSF051]|nr:amino acid adenylation domain-containing protein [Rhizonema sp. NSF051]